MVCLFLYVKKKTDNLKYCLIKMEVCRVGESAPVRKKYGWLATGDMTIDW